MFETRRAHPLPAEDRFEPLQFPLEVPLVDLGVATRARGLHR